MSENMQSVLPRVCLLYIFRHSNTFRLFGQAVVVSKQKRKGPSFAETGEIPLKGEARTNLGPGM